MSEANGTSGHTTPTSDLDESANLIKALELEKKAKKIQFKFEKDINTLYTLGEEVIASGNPPSTVKAVLYGKRKSDGKEVIIKLRNKQKSFKDEVEISEWVATMKLLYYISGGKEQEKKPGNLQLIANLVDIIEDKDNYYAVMERVVGRDLFDYFVQEKIYEKDYKLKLAKKMALIICQSLYELHCQGLIHKDLKLENIVLDESKQKQVGENLVCKPKIIDFDTVDIYRPGHKGFHVLGTDQYIAPETYAGYSTPSSDVWAVGVIMYTILTGCFPFHYALFDDQPGENYVGHARMDQIRRRLRIARIDWSSRVWGQDPLAKDFVRKCFVCDVKRRLTVVEALNHPFLAEEGASGTPKAADRKKSEKKE